MIDKLKKINLIIKLRKLGITNAKVLSIIEKIPREKFIDKELSYKAYQNNALPIDCNQTISQPAVVAKMTELLVPQKSFNVLEIGTGSGYQTAILSKIFKRVYTIERYAQLFNKAKNILTKQKINNIIYYYGYGLKGWPAKFSFKRIIITAVSKKIPNGIMQQLSNDGIMILPLIHNNEQFLTKIIKKNNKIYLERFWRVKFVPLLSGTE